MMPWSGSASGNCRTCSPAFPTGAEAPAPKQEPTISDSASHSATSLDTSTMSVCGNQPSADVFGPACDAWRAAESGSASGEGGACDCAIASLPVRYRPWQAGDGTGQAPSRLLALGKSTHASPLDDRNSQVNHRLRFVK
jgi:hypothetical protein